MKLGPDFHRRAVVLGATAALLGATSVRASTRWQPTKPVKIIVTFPPGGNADLMGRLFGKHLGQALGVPVVIENRVGAAGTIGMAHAAREEPDGHSLLLGDIGTQVITPIAEPTVPYDTQRDFVAISRLTSVSLLLMTHPKLGFNTAAEFLAHARANPGKLTFASAGGGTPSRFAMEALKAAAGIDLLHVPYKGSGPAIVDLVGGQVDCMIDGGSASMVKTGKLTLLGVTGDRSPAFPTMPALHEGAVPGFRFMSWHGIFAPRATPPAVIARLSEEIALIGAKPEVVNTLRDLGITAMTQGPGDFDNFINAQRQSLRNLVRERKIRFDA
jgi:tripartite-type tricarboxylate transporter receptor subunit TctC